LIKDPEEKREDDRKLKVAELESVIYDEELIKGVTK